MKLQIFTMPNYFKPDWIEDWKTERQKGPVRYIILNGFGLAVICMIFDLIVNKRNLLTMEPDRAMVNGGIFIGGGLLYGICSWFFNEYKLKKN